MSAVQINAGPAGWTGLKRRVACGLRVLAAASVMLVAACGGGDEGGAPVEGPAPQAAPTLGVAGGTAREADGAQVVVPAGALQAPTTVRIAKDSTGAPVLPAALIPVGSMYALTPHGTRFDKPATVRVPMPATPPQANQVFKLAKAEPGGTWAVLWDSRVEDGMLTTEMYEFSYVIPVAIPYQIPPAVAAPLSIVSAVLDCGAQDCGAAVGPVDATYRVTVTDGQLPLNCARGSAQAVMDSNTDWWWRPNAPVTVPLTGGTLRRTVGEGPSGVQVFWLKVTCTGLDGVTRFDVATTPQSTYVRWAPRPAYPGISVLRMPASLELVDGTLATVDALLSGGGARPTGATQPAPTVADRAVVEWQRSDDDGRSWRVVAVSYQNEADPLPLGGSNAWRYWSVRHGFRAQAADHGALLRVRACYTPPEGAAPPCAVGPSTRLVMPQGTAAPTIVQAPRPVLVRTGQTASLSAVASATPAATLQWQTRAANATGAWVDVSTGSGGNSGSFTTAVLALADNGTQYRVVARNAVGTAESAPVTVSVSDVDVAPTLTSQPASLSVVSGSDAALAVVARGTEALSYQWRLNGVAITGANAPLLRLPAVDANQAGRYTVTVSNAAGEVTSNPATLTVTPGAVAAAVAPSIVNQPVSVLVNAGNTATFAVGVAGTGPFSYQWLKDGQAIVGANAAFYSLPAAAVADAATYQVQVSNAVGSADSFRVRLTVNAAVLPAPVAINTQPAPQVQPAGGSATFAVAATGSGPLRYQWLKDGQPLAGQTGPVLAINALNGSDAASYSVTVDNGFSAVTSDPAVLTLLGAPAITAQPQGATLPEGDKATFSVTATGQGLRYLWLRNGVPVPGATSAQFTTSALTLADSGAAYSVLVFNNAGVAVSNLAVLSVEPVLPANGAVVIAGAIGSAGLVNAPSGPGSAARLDAPSWLARDAAGNLYVSEGRNLDIRKITREGAVTTLADGRSGLVNPKGLAVGSDGTVYVADGNEIKAITPAGVVSTLSGLRDSVRLQPVTFDDPRGLAIRGIYLFVADFGNYAIKRIDLTNGTVYTVIEGSAGEGLPVDGCSGATLTRPIGIAVDDVGFMWWTEENNTIRFKGECVFTVAGSPGAGGGYADGSGRDAQFSSPQQLSLDGRGKLYVADFQNSVLRRIELRGVSEPGTVTTVFGVVQDATTVAGPNGRIAYPLGVLSLDEQTLVATSYTSHVVLRVTLP